MHKKKNLLCKKCLSLPVYTLPHATGTRLGTRLVNFFGPAMQRKLPRHRIKMAFSAKKSGFCGQNRHECIFLSLFCNFRHNPKLSLLRQCRFFAGFSKKNLLILRNPDVFSRGAHFLPYIFANSRSKSGSPALHFLVFLIS